MPHLVRNLAAPLDVQGVLDKCHDLANVLQRLAATEDPLVVEVMQLAVGILRETQDLVGGKDQDTVKPLSLGKRFADFHINREALQGAFGVKLRLTHDVGAACAVWSDVATARQVTQNLIANAAAAMASEVHIHYQEHDSTVSVVFADNGKGMQPGDVIPQGATGIAIVRNRVHKAGGLVTWESRLGVGTWVTIRLRKVVPTEESS